MKGYKTSQKRRAYLKKWRKANSETVRASAEKYKTAHPDRVKAAYAKSISLNRMGYKSTKLKHMYGITLTQKDAMFAAQGFKCALCETKEPGARGWTVDHCHDSEVVRGVLCNNCNLMLGYAKDKQNTLQAAIRYLDKFEMFK